MILVVNTADKNACLGLYDKKILAEIGWEAARNLSGDILNELNKLFVQSGIKVSEITGIIVCSGPGSFTGLRIGISVANTLAYSLDVPIVGVTGEINFLELCKKGNNLIKKEEKGFGVSVEPFYGSEPNVTLHKQKITK